MGIDWSQKIPAPPPPAEPEVPNLRRSQFEWLVTTQTPQGRYLEDVLAAVLEALKPSEPEGYRLLKSRLAGETFNFAETIQMVEQLRPYLAVLFPDEDISEESILAIWQEALAQ